MVDMAMVQKLHDVEHRLSMRIFFIAILAVIAIAVNGVRTYTNLVGDHRQKRIEYLDKRVAALEAKLEACESGTPQPVITKAGYMIP